MTHISGVNQPHKHQKSFLNRLITRTPAYVTFPAAFCVLSFLFYNTSSFNINIFFIGTIVYTFWEYSIHRWALHVIPLMISYQTYKIVHGRHHGELSKYSYYYPQTLSRVVFPFTHSIPLLTTLSLVSLYVFNNINNALIFIIGMIIAHLSNEILHYYSHGGFDYIHLLEPVRYYHNVHHLISTQIAYGFCTPFWDLIFFSFPLKQLKQKLGNGIKFYVAMIIIVFPFPVPFIQWMLLSLVQSDWSLKELQVYIDEKKANIS
eukprot:510420_1